MNPFQENIDIVKGFFKRKLVLFYAIFTILPIFSLVFIDVTGLMNTFGGFDGGKLLSELPQNTNVSGTAASVYFMFIFEILLAVAFLLFFVKSGSEESSLKAPVGIFRVVSIIKLVIVVLISLASVMVVLFASLHIMANYSVLVSIFTVPFMFMAIPVFLLLIVSQTIFSGNIKESINSIYLKKKGAKFFGVMNLLSAGFCVYFSVLIAVLLINADSQNSFGVADIPYVAFAVLTVIKYIVGALVGIKYSGYIEDFSDSSTARETVSEQNEEESDIPVCKSCGKPLKPDDYFCNHCGTSVEK